MSIEHYLGSNKECIKLMEKSIKNLNIDINMKGLDLNDLMGKALNPSSAEVFKYEWKHAENAKDG